MILLLDNYDSFTWNIYHFLGEVGAQVEVHRNNKISLAQITAMKPEGIVLSPGSCTPNEAGISLDLIQTFSGKIPLLGICLGHEAIGQAFGGNIVRAPFPVHGKLSAIKHKDDKLFAGFAQGFEVARYHSLVVEENTLPDCLEGTAWSADDLLMALAHKSHLTFGVQFHPESIATHKGRNLLENFLKLTQGSAQ